MTTPPTDAIDTASLGDDPALLEQVERLGAQIKAARAAVGRVIFGQRAVIDGTLATLLAGGHCLLIGVPGLAKTRLVQTLGVVLGLDAKRVQFTPDLMPSDITGTEVIQEDKATGTRAFKFLAGPIFANVVLADEINRTPPKTQAALLEAMQERQVTAGGKRHGLDKPFFVLATQNPIEQEGTYPLPEAQQDRFMFKVFVGYPSYDEELQIAELTADDIDDVLGSITQALDASQVMALQNTVRRVPASEHVLRHALDLVRRTRPQTEGDYAGGPSAPSIVRRMVRWGAGPRAVQFLVRAGKARAVLQGRYHLSTDDIRAVAHPVLRHRIMTNFSAEAEGYTADRIISELLEQTPANESELSRDGRVQKVLGS
jgi:MoxR-like ATPase